MATTEQKLEEKARELARSPKYVTARGESFGRILLYLMSALPVGQRVPFFAGLVDVLGDALEGVELPPPQAPPAVARSASSTKAARRKGRT